MVTIWLCSAVSIGLIFTNKYNKLFDLIYNIQILLQFIY
jgi:hypothetical protein